MCMSRNLPYLATPENGSGSALISLQRSVAVDENAPAVRVLDVHGLADLHHPLLHH